MSFIRSILFLLYLSTPLAVNAAVTTEDLPAGTVWYLHADLEQMRSAGAGEALYQWMNEEVFIEVNEETGIDIKNEADVITAYSTSDGGTVIMIEGPLSKETEQRLIAIAGTEGALTESTHKGKGYYFVQDDDDDDDDESDGHHHRSGDPISDLQDGAYFSFSLKNKLLVTGSEGQMKELLDNGGKISGSSNHDGALFVLTADKAFVQAGLNTDEIDDDDDGWDSNILRNTEQVALTIAGVEDNIAIEAQLISTDPAMAQSLGGIANGLVSLQVFNSELDPELKSLLANTKIDVKENVLSVRTVVTADVIVRVLDD
jgi:hypothetical protein